MDNNRGFNWTVLHYLPGYLKIASLITKQKHTSIKSMIQINKGDHNRCCNKHPSGHSGTMILKPNVFSNSFQDLNIMTTFLDIGIPIIKLRQSYDCLIFMTGSPVLVKWYLHVETSPGPFLWLNKVQPNRDNFLQPPSQWEMSSHCNVSSHWLSAYTIWSLPNERKDTNVTHWPGPCSAIVRKCPQIAENFICWFPIFNSLWPSDDIWRQISWSTMVQEMVCCLMTPSHYLNPCWLIISEVQWHSY